MLFIVINDNHSNSNNSNNKRHDVESKLLEKYKKGNVDITAASSKYSSTISEKKYETEFIAKENEKYDNYVDMTKLEKVMIVSNKLAILTTRKRKPNHPAIPSRTKLAVRNKSVSLVKYEIF